MTPVTSPQLCLVSLTVKRRCLSAGPVHHCSPVRKCQHGERVNLLTLKWWCWPVACGVLDCCFLPPLKAASSFKVTLLMDAVQWLHFPCQKSRFSGYQLQAQVLCALCVRVCPLARANILAEFSMLLGLCLPLRICLLFLLQNTVCKTPRLQKEHQR